MGNIIYTNNETPSSVSDGTSALAGDLDTVTDNGGSGETNASPTVNIPRQNADVNENLRGQEAAQTGIDALQNAKSPISNSQRFDPLTQDEQNSILNPYLNAYYNNLNSASSEAQSPNVSPKASVSRDEQLGRYFDEAWDTEDFVSPL